MKLKVLFAAAECNPLVKVGGLADVIGLLPKVLKERGVEVAVALPRYKNLSSATLPVGTQEPVSSQARNKNMPARPKTLPGTDIPLFLVESAEYFGGSEKPYLGTGADPKRFAYFSRQVVQRLTDWGFKPDVIHAHDWHAALIPAIIRKSKLSCATVLTIHNLAMQGISPGDVFFPAGLSERDLKSLEWDFQDKNIDLLLQGIVHADVINTVSSTYAKEILTPEFGEGLQDVLKAREGRISGILNGIDYDRHDPSNDKDIFRTFSLSTRKEGRAANKEALQKDLGLVVDGEVMLIGFVAHLIDQKGLSLIFEGFKQMMAMPIQFVLLGAGNPRYERQFERLSCSNLGKFSAQIRFDDALAHQIFAAADLLLIPSRFEPCGLTQMIAMRYGALPLVRATGGLRDTVVDGQNGFVFEKYEAAQMLAALRRVRKVFGTPMWGQIVEAAMQKDFSWKRSAEKYVSLYERALAYAKAG